MSVEVTPSGTRGGKFPRMPGPFMRLMNDVMFRLFRNRPFQGGGHLLALTTVGARSGQERRSTVMYFPDTDKSWLIVASAGGAAAHPAWFLNLAKNPDKVRVEIGNRKVQVTPETLKGEERARAWQRVVALSPGFGGYESKTDREIPVIRLTAMS
jgi:deazaflavin-dependent oxidoreductase (nitroreductase family)